MNINKEIDRVLLEERNISGNMVLMNTFPFRYFWRKLLMDIRGEKNIWKKV